MLSPPPSSIAAPCRCRPCCRDSNRVAPRTQHRCECNRRCRRPPGAPQRPPPLQEHCNRCHGSPLRRRHRRRRHRCQLPVTFHGRLFRAVAATTPTAAAPCVRDRARARRRRRTLVTPTIMFSMCEHADWMEAPALPEVNQRSTWTMSSPLSFLVTVMSSGRCVKSFLTSPRGPLTTTTRAFTVTLTPSGIGTSVCFNMVFCECVNTVQRSRRSARGSFAQGAAVAERRSWRQQETLPKSTAAGSSSTRSEHERMPTRR